MTTVVMTMVDVAAGNVGPVGVLGGGFVAVVFVSPALVVAGEVAADLVDMVNPFVPVDVVSAGLIVLGVVVWVVMVVDRSIVVSFVIASSIGLA